MAPPMIIPIGIQQTVLRPNVVLGRMNPEAVEEMFPLNSFSLILALSALAELLTIFFIRCGPTSTTTALLVVRLRALHLISLLSRLQLMGSSMCAFLFRNVVFFCATQATGYDLAVNFKHTCCASNKCWQSLWLSVKPTHIPVASHFSILWLHILGWVNPNPSQFCGYYLKILVFNLRQIFNKKLIYTISALILLQLLESNRSELF